MGRIFPRTANPTRRRAMGESGGVRILLTSSRLPFSLALIRGLTSAGHEVYAADAYDVASGSHSRYVAGRLVTAPPATETERFVDDVERFAEERSIDRVVPAFEEAFYLATRRDRLDEVTELFTPPFATLAGLHDKASFTTLAQKLGLPLPETVVVRSPEELREAIGRWPQWFARACFSRGGVALLTNSGPLADHTKIEDVDPSEAQPWLVQPYVEGPMQCTYSTLREGRVLTHLCYRAPRQWQHSTGISFTTVDPEPTLPIVEAIGRELGYTGQMSLDFVVSPTGLNVIECNPRATDGALLMEPEEMAAGLAAAASDEPADPILIPAERSAQLDFAVFGQMFTESPREWPRSIHDLVEIRGSDRGWHDELPNLYALLTLGHHARLNLRHRRALLAAMADDIAWDGQPIEGMSPEDRELVRSLTGE
jgi:predicted ATP-grasp superfamily ATP-dependent carboligase